MSTDPTTAYFDEIVQRAVGVPIMRYEPWPDARRNECHENCERFIQCVDGYSLVRGWLVASGHWLMPHSVVRELSSGELVDITPREDEIPFIEHRRSEQDFAILRRGRDGGWLHPGSA